MLSAVVESGAEGEGSASIALLLPAVQKVREAADRTQVVAELASTPPQARIGLLLPAVQKVREAANR